MLPGPQGARGCHPILNASPYCTPNPTKFEIRTLGGASGNTVSAGGESKYDHDWRVEGGAIFAVGVKEKVSAAPLGRNICGRRRKEKVMNIINTFFSVVFLRR